MNKVRVNRCKKSLLSSLGFKVPFAVLPIPVERGRGQATGWIASSSFGQLNHDRVSGEKKGFGSIQTGEISGRAVYV